MKNLSYLVNRIKEKNTGSSDSYPGKANFHESNWIEMDDKITKNDLDIVHLEFSPDPVIPGDNNKLVAEVFDASEDAKEADDSERGMPLTTALKTYPKAAAWSLLVSTTLIMEGYDTAILGAFYALPVFQKEFGSQDAQTGEWEILASWQIGLTLCYMAGEIVGLQMTGPLVDWMGNRYTLIMALFLLTCFTFLLYFCKSLGMIAAGQALCGMPSVSYTHLDVYKRQV